jgi:hypothetical protein
MTIEVKPMPKRCPACGCALPRFGCPQEGCNGVALHKRVVIAVAGREVLNNENA